MRRVSPGIYSATSARQRETLDPESSKALIGDYSLVYLRTLGLLFSLVSHRNGT